MEKFNHYMHTPPQARYAIRTFEKLQQPNTAQVYNTYIWFTLLLQLQKCENETYCHWLGLTTMHLCSLLVGDSPSAYTYTSVRALEQ
jgi:hypothetical protein